MATCLLEGFFSLLWQNLSSFWNVLLKLCCTFNYNKLRFLISERCKEGGVFLIFFPWTSVHEAWIFFHFCSCLCLCTCWGLSACIGFSLSRSLHSCRMTDPLSSMKMAHWQLLEISRASVWFNDLHRQECWPRPCCNEIKAVTIKWELVNK